MTKEILQTWDGEIYEILDWTREHSLAVAYQTSRETGEEEPVDKIVPTEIVERGRKTGPIRYVYRWVREEDGTTRGETEWL